jgi:hypothetical protein
MSTTTVVSDNTATIVRDDVSRFRWGPVIAGAVIATAITFLLVSFGSGLGLALSSAHSSSTWGIKTFLTAGAIYFVAAQAFGFAVGGHITGRLLGPEVDESEEETFRTDAHGLAVWALGVVFGLAVLALTAGPSISAGASSRAITTPVNYWVDKLFRPAPGQQAALAYQQFAQNDATPTPSAVESDAAAKTSAANPAGTTMMPSGPMDSLQSGSMSANRPTLADIKGEAARILTADTATGQDSGATDKPRLVQLVSQNTGLNTAAATDRVNAVESDMRAKAKELADAARKAASYLAIWTAVALLFSAAVCVVATLSARWEENRSIFGRGERR